MKLIIAGSIVAEGSIEELTQYTFLLFELFDMKRKKEMTEMAKKEADAIARAIQSSIEDLKEQEREESE